MATEAETTAGTRSAGGLDRAKSSSKRRCALALTVALFAAVTGAGTYVLIHKLAAPLPSEIGGALTVTSGLTWAASVISPSHSTSRIWLNAVAAWLTFLAGVCALR
jgi:hypothetical protein